MLAIIVTEAIEFGGLQEVPSQQRGGKTSFHAAKRVARGVGESNGGLRGSDKLKVKYRLRIARGRDGKLHWKD